MGRWRDPLSDPVRWQQVVNENWAAVERQFLPGRPCLHTDAGLRLNDVREIEVCAGCGIEIEGVTEQGKTEDSYE